MASGKSFLVTYKRIIPGPFTYEKNESDDERMTMMMYVTTLWPYLHAISISVLIIFNNKISLED